MTELTVDVEGVGGIDQASHTFEPGVTLVTGPNASNKTSLLEAVAFAVGSDDVRIRAGADKARVALSLGDRTVEREAVRHGRGVEYRGETWTSSEVATAFETFGSLREFNPLRSAVSQGDDVEDLLKAPVDTDELERRRSEKLSKKQQYQRDLEGLADVEDELEQTKADLADARQQVDDLEAKLETLYDRRDDDGDEELQELRERQSDIAAERDRLREQVAEFESSIEEYERRQDELTDRIKDLEADIDEVDIEALREERSTLEQRQAEIEGRIDVLQSIRSTNREVVDAELAGVLGRNPGLEDETVTCWTCGQETGQDAVEETIGRLSELISEERARKRENQPRIEELDERIEAFEDRRRERGDLRTERQDLERKITDRRESLDTKRNRLEEVREQLDGVEAELAERERAAASQDLVEEIESTRVDLQTARREVDRLESKLAGLRERREERDDKREAVDRLSSEIVDLTDRIESLEADIREAFNDAMEDVLAALEYRRIERVWLDGSFDIVVAREVDGSVREDAVEHLSESEREVVGLVLGLAGYSVYDVAESAPVLLLDSVDAFDATRTDLLLSFFKERTDFLLVAVLSETATEMSVYDQVTLRASAAAPD